MSADVAPGVVLGGRYKPLQLLGSGGLGIVWLADQLQPVRRKVALKLVKLGMDSEQVLSRFEAERNALTIMNHPSIARVLDAGMTDRGRPYFVMEYVPGEPITKFCDRERLDMRQRLELFIQVCDAVQHAHQKSIIHRDLKPSNILVMMHEGRPLAKVIDFGIAKATGAELTEKTLFTEHGQLIGTPEYMSPEQAEITAVGVDSTTDIYSLGVILYELLTGVLPFDSRTLRGKGFAEIQRIIREEEPHKPSTRLSTLGDTTTTVVKQRCTDARTLKRLLKGDLDWITMRAMEKQRTRRYPSASEMAADIKRHLHDEPVLAGPPALGYRAAKFIRRNRVAVVSGSLIGLALLLGMVGLAWGLVEANAMRIDAVAARSVAEEEAARAQEAEAQAEAQRSLAEEAAARARAEARRASSITGFVLGVLGLADPDVSHSPDTTMRDVLVRAGEEVGFALRGEPKAEQAVRVVLARTLNTLGEHETAKAHIDRAMRLADDLDDLPLATRSEMLLTALWITVDSGEADGSIVMQWWDSCEQLIHEAQPDIAAVLRRLRAHAAEGSVEEGRAMLREALDTASDLLQRTDPLWIQVGMYLHASGTQYGWRPLGVEFTEAALNIYRRFFRDTHTSVVRAVLLLLDQLHNLERYKEAAALAHDQLERLRRALPEGHWYQGHAEFRLGQALTRLGEYDEARSLLTSAAERMEAAFGDAHASYFRVCVALADLSASMERDGDADAWRHAAARAHAGMEWSASPSEVAPVLPPDRRELTDLMVAFDELFDDNRPPEPDMVDRILELRRMWKNDEPHAGMLAEMVRFRANRARIRRAYDLSERMFLDAIGVFRENPHVHSAKLGRALREYAHLLNAMERFEDAEGAAREGVTILRNIYGDEYIWTANAHRQLGIALGGLGRFAEAERHLAIAYQSHLDRRGTAATNAQGTLEDVVVMYAQWKGPAHGAAFAAEEVRKHLNERSTAPEWLRRVAANIVMFGGLDDSTYEVALAAAERSLELQPDSHYAIALLARSQMRLGMHDQAIATMDRAKAADRTLNAWDLGAVALAHHALGQQTRAEKARDQLENRMASIEHPWSMLTQFVEEVERTLAGESREP